MRKYGKTDANQKEVVKLLRDMGCSVQSLASIGDGCPDLLIGYKQKNYLVELKDGKKPPSQRHLTPDEVIWKDTWRGQYLKADSFDEIFKLINK